MTDLLIMGLVALASFIAGATFGVFVMEWGRS